MWSTARERSLATHSGAGSRTTLWIPDAKMSPALLWPVPSPSCTGRLITTASFGRQISNTAQLFTYGDTGPLALIR